MTLVRRPDGVYEGDFRAKGLPRLHLSLRTAKKGDARDRHDAVRRCYRERRADMIDQLRAGVLTVERVAAMAQGVEPFAALAGVAPVTQGPAWGTVDDTITAYLAWMATTRRTAKTRKLAGFQCQRFQEFAIEGQRIGDRLLDGITRAHVLAYQQSMLDAKTPPNTVSTYMARVGALWRWAERNEERTAREEKRAPRPLHSPVDHETLVRETTRRDRVLTIDEANRLLAATPDRLLFPVACGLLAGLRVGEMLHLRPGLDVDLEAGAVSVRKQPDWRPKTKRSIRLVPMSHAMLTIAERHAKEYASASWMLPSLALGYEGKPMTELGFRAHFQAIVERAGLQYGRSAAQGVTYHTLRHTFASHAVMRGVDLYTVAKLLGDSLKIVEDTYADLSPDFKRAAVAKLAAAFNLPRNDTARDTGNGE